MDKNKLNNAWALLCNMSQELENCDCHIYSVAIQYVADKIKDAIATPEPDIKSFEETRKDSK